MNEDIIYLGGIGGVVSDQHSTYEVLNIFNDRRNISVRNQQTGYHYSECDYRDFPGCSMFGKRYETNGSDGSIVAKSDAPEEILQDISFYF